VTVQGVHRDAHGAGRSYPLGAHRVETPGCKKGLTAGRLRVRVRTQRSAAPLNGSSRVPSSHSTIPNEYTSAGLPYGSVVAPRGCWLPGPAVVMCLEISGALQAEVPTCRRASRIIEKTTLTRRASKLAHGPKRVGTNSTLQRRHAAALEGQKN
jgi:hypothetical protein